MTQSRPTPLSPLLGAYASRHGIDDSAWGPDGRITVVFDEKYRVLLRPVSDGRVLLSSMLLDLTAIAASRLEDVLLQLASSSARMIRDYASGLVIDEDAQRLLLEQVVPASLDAIQLETELGNFVNSLAFWSRTSQREVGRL